MTRSRTVVRWLLAFSLVFCAGRAGLVYAQQTQEGFQPQVGQEGKDVVWVPTSEILLERMLDMANVTPQDFVVDLGSGDGRNVIAAAKRGARGLGVEYNPDMVELSRRIADREGVSDKATFVQGDMYEAEFSQASVLALFLLPQNLLTLRPKFLNLTPGTRIVANTFAIPEWEADESQAVEGDCVNWCTSLLWIVPANVRGTWRLAEGELRIEQEYQKISGKLLYSTSVSEMAKARLRGDQISFVLGDTEYVGRVSGNLIEGTFTSGQRRGDWMAFRVAP